MLLRCVTISYDMLCDALSADMSCHVRFMFDMSAQSNIQLLSCHVMSRHVMCHVMPCYVVVRCGVVLVSFEVK